MGSAADAKKLKGKIMKYEIWSDNGISTFFESDSHSFNDVLDEFCKDAGYADHSDYLQQMDLNESPFNIKEVTHESI